MCEYALKKDGKRLMCAYTGKLCTLCVLGNGNTFMEAVAATETNKKEQEYESKNQPRSGGGTAEDAPDTLCRA